MVIPRNRREYKLPLADGANTFTAIATDGLGRTATNSVTLNLPATVSFTYDANGNMTSDGLRTFVYDDENQLISVYVANSWKTDSIYDGMNRRRVRRDYVWRNGAWATTAETLYVYDGNLNVQERNGDNVPLVTYTRGIDLSGGLSDAGGIGGLLARTDHTTLPNNHSFYHQDGNGNVTTLVKANQQIGAQYTYDPYGNVLARSGPLAEANRMQFSGKETDQQSGLSYYGRRFYEPKLQRWMNEDPIGFKGGNNLFQGFAGDPINTIDPNGLIVASWDGDVARVSTKIGLFWELILTATVNLSFCCALDYTHDEQEELLAAALRVWNGMRRMRTPEFPRVLLTIRVEANVDWSSTTYYDPIWNTVYSYNTSFGRIAPGTSHWLNFGVPAAELQETLAFSASDPTAIHLDPIEATRNSIHLFRRRIQQTATGSAPRQFHDPFLDRDPTLHQRMFAHEFGHILGQRDHFWPFERWWAGNIMTWPNLGRHSEHVPAGPLVGPLNAREILVNNRILDAAIEAARALQLLTP